MNTVQLKTFVWNRLSRREQNQLLERPTLTQNEALKTQVTSILQAVQTQGDVALLQFTKNWDQVELTPSTLQVTPAEIENACATVSPSIHKALQDALQRITPFHQAQVPRRVRVETSSGVVCERRFLPIERVGLYIPGGTAPLPSTVLMLGVPSKLAGCKTRIVATPPRKDGSIDPVILPALHFLGLQKKI